MANILKKIFISEDFKKQLSEYMQSSQKGIETAREMYRANDELKKIVSEELNAVSSATSALVEVTEMLQKTTDSANDLANSTQRANQVVGEGQGALTDVLNKIEVISGNSDKLTSELNAAIHKMEAIFTGLAEIKNKSKVINDIVFQTRLLAFNASIEAARAGEYGKGFSVVAEEMGNLANSSGMASKEISAILEENLEQTTNIITDLKKEIGALSEKSHQDAKDGLASGEICTQKFQEIVQEVLGVSNKADDIKLASSEQAIGVREISNAMQGIQAMTTSLDSLSTNLVKSSMDLSESSEKHLKEFYPTLKDMNIEVLDPNRFDFKKAVGAHLGWRMKLTKYIENPDGSLVADKVCKDNLCDLGKWIYGDGVSYDHYHSYEDLRNAHAKFHKVAGQVITHMDKGQKNQAMSLLSPEGEYTKASDYCISKIEELQHEVEGDTHKKSA